MQAQASKSIRQQKKDRRKSKAGQPKMKMRRTTSWLNYANAKAKGSEIPEGMKVYAYRARRAQNANNGRDASNHPASGGVFEHWIGGTINSGIQTMGPRENNPAHLTLSQRTRPKPDGSFYHLGHNDTPYQH